MGSAQKAKNIQYRTYQRLILSILLLLIIHHTYQTPTRYISKILRISSRSCLGISLPSYENIFSSSSF